MAADLPSRSRVVPILSPAHPANSIETTHIIIQEQDATTEHENVTQESRHVSDPSDNVTDSKLELKLACLDERGLYAFPTKGDGNCLYYALSDQVYGDFNHSECIRSRLANHIDANRQYFMNFMGAAGGERRAPKRAAASAARAAWSSSFSPSTSSSPSPSSSFASSPVRHTSKEQEQMFENSLSESRRNGVWGGSEQIQAFCQSYERDVHVYTEHGVQHFRDVNAPTDATREAVHIAYHSFNHYSSVRNVDGPHSGLPRVLIKPDVRRTEAEDEADDDPSRRSSAVVDMATPWKISTIEEGLGGKHDRATIVEMLQQCRGDIERAFSKLLDEEPSGPAAFGQSTSPSPAPDTSLAHSAMDGPAAKPILRHFLQNSSRSSSPFSTASKRSAEDSDAEESAHPAPRRSRMRDQKRRILPDVTVGIAFRDKGNNDLISLRLRVSPDAAAEQAASVSPDAATNSPVDTAGDFATESEPGRQLTPRLGRGRRAKLKHASEAMPADTTESTNTALKPRRSLRNTSRRTVQRES